MSERAYDVVTFDCYGTLIDWRAGITEAFIAAAAPDGVKVDPATLLALYAEIEPAVEEEMYRSYRDVLVETARRVGARLGWSISAARATFLPRSLPAWRPFEDTNAALERLARAGYTLGILSNIDDDLLAETRRHFTVDFELIVTAQQVHSYKPAHGHFTTARQRLGDRLKGNPGRVPPPPPERWLHAAQSYFHDVEPAHALGVSVAWINRHAEPLRPGGVVPDREFRRLSELADWLA